MTWRGIIALIFVGLQALLVLRARFVQDRYFSWAPHDRQVEFRIEGVMPDGSDLKPHCASRYQLPHVGWASHTAEDVIWVVDTREARLSPEERAEVSVHHRANGGPWQVWSRP